MANLQLGVRSNARGDAKRLRDLEIVGIGYQSGRRKEVGAKG